MYDCWALNNNSNTITNHSNNNVTNSTTSVAVKKPSPPSDITVQPLEGARPRSRSEGGKIKKFRYHEYKYPVEKIKDKEKKVAKRGGTPTSSSSRYLPTPRFEALMEQQEQYILL